MAITMVTLSWDIINAACGCIVPLISGTAPPSW